MRFKHMLAAGTVVLCSALTSTEAVAFTAPPTVAEAEATVRQAREALQRAEQAEAAAREIATAQEEAARANARLLEAQTRIASSSSDPAASRVQAAAVTAEAREAARDEAQAEAEETATRKFGGVEFGVGLSFTADIGSNDRVATAEVVNGIVRVTDVNNGRARIMLESHYFFKQDAPFLGGLAEREMWGWGPFVAIQPGEGEVIDAIAGGLMIGFRRSRDSTASFNLGVGFVIDPNTRILGEGIVANQPLPVGETEIRYRETMQSGILFMASFAF